MPPWHLNKTRYSVRLDLHGSPQRSPQGEISKSGLGCRCQKDGDVYRRIPHQYIQIQIMCASDTTERPIEPFARSITDLEKELVLQLEKEVASIVEVRRATKLYPDSYDGSVECVYP